MSKSFRKISPIRLHQVLETCEKIIMINNEDEKNPILNDLYKIIHPFIGRCKNSHDDWREFEEEMNEKLKNY